ncbi:MAG: M20/M25/M40 family metallo-hydrolase [Ruminococcaceae bacterium]|nr:M20/M25/M40 family metallo-hydrolase [Oscillospiraceae bacterium]
MLYVLIGLGALLLILISVILIRALMFNAPPLPVSDGEELYVNGEKAVSDLAEMIRCKTISSHTKSEEDDAEFDKFKATLKRLFPKVYESCEYNEVGARAILLRYKGKSADAPTVLMSHYDVVSVEEANWDKPPFDGVLENGVLWGRGALDTKGTLNGVMQAMEALISEGFVPENDIYMAFAGDEEINGTGAPSIVDIFEEKGIKPAFVLDEGGAVVENVFPGVKLPCALIGIAEKGILNAELSFSGNGGHASSPKPHTPVGRLSRACVRIEENPQKFRVSEPTALMLDTLARHSTFVYKIIFANLWCFAPVLDLICKKSGGELNALLRTTCAFTQMEGSKGINVIPPNARMAANLRILPGETMDGTLEYLKKTVNDKDITVSKISGTEPSVISTVNAHGWDKVASAVSSTWKNTIISPYLMFAASDSRHWGRICDKVYRFSAMALTAEERGTIHGNNERIPVETVKKTVEFYIRLIKQC